MDRTPFLLAVVIHTPGWVWLLLALLVVLRWRLSVTHEVTRTRVLALPGVMGLVALGAASSHFGWHAWVQGPWLLGLAAGVLTSLWLQWPRHVRALPDGRFEIGGSWTPLVMMLLVFATRYAIEASLAIVPALALQPGFAGVASAVYGLPTGLLAARAARVLAAGSRPQPAMA